MKTNNLKKDTDAPKSITVNVEYNQEIEKITGIKRHPVVMNYGATFMFLLQSIFIEYPEIEKQYPPSILGFSINGVPPKLYTPLFDEDTVFFYTNKN